MKWKKKRMKKKWKKKRKKKWKKKKKRKKKKFGQRGFAQRPVANPPDPQIWTRDYHTTVKTACNVSRTVTTVSKFVHSSQSTLRV